ncbi:MAG: MarR family transcriptional regulator [Gammaproteobacteria bacterium]|jgi:MarR family transcriptional regulator for hemolysin
MTDPAPQNTLGFLLHEVTRLMRRNFSRRVELTQAQWRTLAYLSRNEGINQAGLAELLEVRPITLARLIDRLEQAGWVERRTDPGDRRACRLFLTEQAGPLIKQMQRLGAKTTDQALAGFSAAARERLIENLNEIKRNLLAAEAELEKTRSTD